MTPVGIWFGVSAVLAPHRVHALFRLPAKHDSLDVALVLLVLLPCGCLGRWQWECPGTEVATLSQVLGCANARSSGWRALAPGAKR